MKERAMADVKEFLKRRYPVQRQTRMYLSDDDDLRKLVRPMRPEEMAADGRSILLAGEIRGSRYTSTDNPQYGKWTGNDEAEYTTREATFRALLGD